LSKAETLDEASIEERNFVRRKLLQLRSQKWQSPAEVETGSTSQQRTVSTSGNLVKKKLLQMKNVQSFLIRF